MRGGFRSTVHSATGTGKAKPATPFRRSVTNLITIALLVVAAVLLLRRFGVLH
jgi:flagellar biogenesis protein FliO